MVLQFHSAKPRDYAIKCAIGQVEPPLLLRAKVRGVSQPRHIFQVQDLEMAALQADECRAARTFSCFIHEELDAARCQQGGLNPIERRGVAALRQMPEDRLPHVKEILILLFEQRTYKARSL
jgi:hypothetical protein